MPDMYFVRLSKQCSSSSIRWYAIYAKALTPRGLLPKLEIILSEVKNNSAILV